MVLFYANSHNYYHNLYTHYMMNLKYMMNGIDCIQNLNMNMNMNMNLSENVIGSLLNVVLVQYAFLFVLDLLDLVTIIVVAVDCIYIVAMDLVFVIFLVSAEEES